MNTSVESKGNTLPVGVGVVLGLGAGMGVGGAGYACATPTPIVTSARAKRLSERRSAGRSARALFLGRRGAFAFFNELLDFLTTFLPNSFIKVGAVPVPRCFAALFAALFTDLLVKLLAVGLFGGKSTFATDFFVKLRAVLMLDGFPAFLAGLANGHSAAARVLVCSA